MSAEASSRVNSSGKAVIALPFVWLTIFFALPFLFVLKISFSRQRDGQPPYEPVFDPSAGFANLKEASKFSADSYFSLISDSLYIEAYLSSLSIAAIATIIALLIAYPLAYAMTRAPRRWQALLIVLAVAPFWTSFLIRIYAWIVILKDEGLLNQFLLSVGLISSPIHIYATQSAVVIGIVYSYLPFMILPIYNSLEKQDHALVEAALDLGASPFRAFRTVTLPLSLRGVIAGCLLVFIPAVGEYVIPDLLGGSDTLMIGRTIWDEFSSARNWPGAAALAIIMLAILIVPIAIYQRTQSVGSRA
jgi:putrescine transport system permease protein